MDFSKISDDQLLEETSESFALERKISNRILFQLKEIEARNLFAKRGYHSMFWMLIKYFKQSETAANQKLKALDLMIEVPVVEERLASGELNLSTVALAQRQIRREEIITGKSVSSEKKAEIVDAITDKTLAEAQVELFRHLPETASKPEETVRRISEDTTRMCLNIPDDVLEMMNRLKDLWAHVDPTMDSVEVIRRAFKIALQRVDPSERKSKPRSATETAKRRSTGRWTYYPKDLDAQLWQRAGSRCEWVDPESGKRCECTFGLQREHVISIALGGTNDLSNLQLLCRTHNLLRARTVFGDAKINFHQQQKKKRERE